MEEYSIYCDETCHLENDSQPVMVLGAIWCPTQKRQEIYSHIRKLKAQHNIQHTEMKWTKISPKNLPAYLTLIDYFFNNSDLHFRAVVIPDKNKLNHDSFSQTHDQWYYKMYFDLLKTIMSKNARYNTFLDIKDTTGGEKVQKLTNILSTKLRDPNHNIVKKIQLIHSHEVNIMQLVDILTGAIMAANRKTTSSAAKQALITEVKKRSKLSLSNTTSLGAEKLNILIWHSGER